MMTGKKTALMFCVQGSANTKKIQSYTHVSIFAITFPTVSLSVPTDPVDDMSCGLQFHDENTKQKVKKKDKKGSDGGCQGQIVLKTMHTTLGCFFFFLFLEPVLIDRRGSIPSVSFIPPNCSSLVGELITD